MQVRLLTKTQGLEGTEYFNKSIDEIIVGKARASSSRDVNELFDEPHKLLRHCILNQHWSIFDQCHLGFEIKTSRAMGRELLRHSSIHPQEFSQRYAEVYEHEPIELRLQSKSNRQSSTELYTSEEEIHDQCTAQELVGVNVNESFNDYSALINEGIAKECARFILPECTSTTLHMEGSIRSWITLLNARLHQTAQKEIRLIAERIVEEFIKHCPVIANSLYNFEDAYDIHILERVVLEKYGVYKLIKDNKFKKVKL
jgi:thymidylate synthase (FAD)